MDRIIPDVDYPNGLAFSPDERRLSVANARPGQYILVYEVHADGTVSHGRHFAEMPSPDATNGVEETMPTTCAVLAPDDHRLVHELLADVGECAAVGQRLRLITARLLGAPYLTHPLVGSATEPEVLTVTLQGFDCVTLVETALALAWADDSEAFLTLLRQVRYRHGEIAWQQRLHYATDWLHHHVQHGRLSEVVCGEAMQRITRRLDVLPGFPPHTATWRYFPTEALPAVSARVVDGDIIFFVSMRQELDVFHLGVLFRATQGVLLRHAARSRGQVVEQELADFCAANTMPGFLIARPCEKPHYQ